MAAAKLVDARGVMSRPAAAILFGLILWSRPTLAGEAQAPKLEAVVPPTAAADEAPAARPLPRALTICIDRAQRRCWSGESEADCDAEGGTLFAAGPAAGGDPGSLLRSCWDELRQ
jgi:hypothetical protein